VAQERIVSNEGGFVKRIMLIIRSSYRNIKDPSFRALPWHCIARSPTLSRTRRAAPRLGLVLAGELQDRPTKRVATSTLSRLLLPGSDAALISRYTLLRAEGESAFRIALAP
jgi:hypothetical protein